MVKGSRFVIEGLPIQIPDQAGLAETPNLKIAPGHTYHALLTAPAPSVGLNFTAHFSVCVWETLCNHFKQLY